jgi:hypothetical protein
MMKEFNGYRSSYCQKYLSGEVNTTKSEIFRYERGGKGLFPRLKVSLSREGTLDVFVVGIWRASEAPKSKSRKNTPPEIAPDIIFLFIFNNQISEILIPI